jgi:transposase
MSLKPQPIGPIPELTAYVARAAFLGGNPYMSLRDTLGTFYDDKRFAALFPDRGQPAGPAPVRLDAAQRAQAEAFARAMQSVRILEC